MTRARRLELGDWQTPPALAAQAVEVLARHAPTPPSLVLEPTCGTGAFLTEAATRFPRARLRGLDLAPERISAAREALAPFARRLHLRQADFFSVDWSAELPPATGPLWVLGNPPWVTTARQGALGSANVPTRENRQRLAGLDALTGKSNFDISEAMLQRLLTAFAARSGVLAVLCKAAVARRVIAFAAREQLPVAPLALWRIDAARWFNAAVEAVWFACRLGEGAAPSRWPVYAALDAEQPERHLSVQDGRVVADGERIEATRQLAGQSPVAWRSGLKHDCAKVLELRDGAGRLLNGLGEVVDVEVDHLFPLLKSSDLTNDRTPRRQVLVPQRTLKEDSSALATSSPRTWAYLHRHEAAFARRRSSIYRGRDRFAVFGVGPYSFAPWKVAVAGLAQRLDFRVVGPVDGKPVLFDDTCYFLPFETEAEARRAHAALTSPPAQAFFEARVFWDMKRPITRELLSQLDWARLT